MAVLAILSTVTLIVAAIITTSNASQPYYFDAIKDVTLSGTASRNGDDNLAVGYYSQAIVTPRKRLLIQFDVSTIPTGCILESATMQLYYKGAVPSTAVTHQIKVHIIKKPWVESQATSTHRTSGQRWGTNYVGTDGIDAFQQHIDDVQISTSVAGGYMNFDIKTAVSAWRSFPTSNHGLLLKSENEPPSSNAEGIIQFYTRANPNKKPRLEVICQ